MLEIGPMPEFRVEALQICSTYLIDKTLLPYGTWLKRDSVQQSPLKIRREHYEKEYPLSNDVMILILSGRLQAEEDNEMARDLVMKIFMEANRPRNISVKEKQEKDKVGSKPDKNRKRVEAGKNLKQLQWKLEEKQIEKEQEAKAQNQKLPVCYDDDDDEEESNSLKDNNISELPPCFAVTPSEPIDSLSMRDEHLDTIPAMESDEFLKSCVENLVPNPSESEGENGCDVPSCFTTFSNILFDDEYEFNSIDDQSLHNENFSEKIFSNPLFEEEIISIKKNQHHFNAEFDLVESMLNHDSSIVSSSLKIDSLLDEFAGELTLLKSIPPGIDKTNCPPENEIRLSQRLLYDNSSPRPLEEFNSENSNAEIESFSPSPIPNEDSDSFMKEIDLFLTSDDPMPPSIEDDEDSEGDILFLERLLHDDPIPLPDDLDFSYEVIIFLPFFTYPVTSPVLLSSGSEDKIFDPGITVNHFYSF
nr:hypothetical protein [Tanacetum cinerariifolium]